MEKRDGGRWGGGGVTFSTGIIQTQAGYERTGKVRHTFSSEPEIKFQKWREKKITKITHTRGWRSIGL